LGTNPKGVNSARDWSVVPQILNYGAKTIDKKTADKNNLLKPLFASRKWSSLNRPKAVIS
jgi:hypothetical protein